MGSMLSEAIIFRAYFLQGTLKGTRRFIVRMPAKYQYEAVPGFFVHDTSDHGLSTVSALPPRMGLLDDSRARWHNFRERIAKLNEELKKENGEAKVFFFARHGQGWHNVAIEKYEIQLWDGELSKRDGDGEIVWGPDPELTEIGISQAVEAKRAWEAELPFNIILPERLYSSPLTRAMDTLRITFGGIIVGDVEDKQTVLILENCREEHGVHTCDKRKTRSWIHERFPDFDFEEGFSEEDPLWDSEVRETKAEVAERARGVLDYIFEKDTSSTYISVTAHAAIINGFLQAIGRPKFGLSTGGILPVVIKCQKY